MAQFLLPLGGAARYEIVIIRGCGEKVIEIVKKR
jgi:hypothetical protein